ncbi:Alpha/Beta hydrolase protein [Gloeopeniophorella convolvens]|nr:Alpha/Beta hydrolase protein [Gloeopeniophorella convolvens]
MHTAFLGLVANDSTDIPRFLPAFCDRDGVALVSANYRLAPQAYLPESLADVRDALAWCTETLPDSAGSRGHLVDGTRVALSGGSMGGWLTLLLGSEQHACVRALAALYPMTNLSDENFSVAPPIPPIPRSVVAPYIDGPMAAGATPDTDYAAHPPIFTGRSRAVVYMAQEHLWAPWILRAAPDDAAAPAAWDARLKVRDAPPGRWPPTAVVHGADDMLIPPSNGSDIADALKARGEGRFFWQLVPNAGHFLDMICDPRDDAGMDALGLTPLWAFVLAALRSGK